ncbi:hypothetical protein MKX01_042724 [Papaver californicum]|nr:hypothetical protein MKX01_042724 [Papaver californicum]
MDSVRQLKVQQYEDFVDRRLKPDLVDKVFESHKVFSDLRKSVETLEKNAVMSLCTLVNLGSEVPDTRHIFLDVGLGFHVEFTWPEALEFISLKGERTDKFVKVFRSCSSFSSMI